MRCPSCQCANRRGDLHTEGFGLDTFVADSSRIHSSTGESHFALDNGLINSAKKRFLSEGWKHAQRGRSRARKTGWRHVEQNANCRIRRAARSSCTRQIRFKAGSDSAAGFGVNSSHLDRRGSYEKSCDGIFVLDFDDCGGCVGGIYCTHASMLIAKFA